MQRRNFLLTVASATLSGIAVSGCGTTSTTSATHPDQTSPAEKKKNIDAAVDGGLARLYQSVPGSRELAQKANGVLLFPSVLNAGFGIGGEYGEGALRVKNVSEAYYNIAGISFGLQIGAQSKMVGFFFMTPDALDRFRNSAGWSVGGDASVALIKMGANGSIDINSVKAPVVAFVLTNAGLMANLSFSGTKITRLKDA